MDQGILEQAAKMAARVGHIFISTADSAKLPYLALAKKLTVKGEGLVAVEEWYSPGNIENFRLSTRVAVVVWDRNVDRGFQLMGETIYPAEEMANYPFVKEGKNRIDENRLFITVKKAVDFTSFFKTNTEE